MKPQLQLLAIFLVVLGAGYWGYLQLFEEEGEVPGLVVLEIVGDVQLNRGQTGGGEVTVGTELLQSDHLVVGAGGRAVLGLGEGTRLELDSDSTVQIVGIDRDGVMLELEEGRVQAKVQPGAPSVRVAHGAQSAGSEGGQFSFSATSEDEVLVRSSEGSVSLEGFGDLQTLEAGSYAKSVPGKPIISAEEAEELLLSIQWPEARARAEAESAVRGRTAPHAEVTLTVDGADTPVTANAAGEFSVDLDLQEGPNQIEIEAVDPLGRTKTETGEVEIISTVNFDAEIEY
jgi:hypothetical protein